MEELLRETASLGNLDGVQKLLQSGTNINSQNSTNGWTALHWACKRGHSKIVQLLLHSGADANIKTHNGELPVHVATVPDVIKLLGEGESTPMSTATKLPIIPHYLENPPFPYYDISKEQERALRVNQELASVRGLNQNGDNTKSVPVDMKSTLSEKMESLVISGPKDDDLRICSSQTGEVGSLVIPGTKHDEPEICSGDGVSKNGGVNPHAESFTVVSSNHSSLPLLVKVRVAGSGESDFVEVEVPSLSYQALLRACCEELEVGASDVIRLRKLPNIWVRKDRDVQRMKEGQELEVVLKND